MLQHIKVPSKEEMATMPIEELKKWRDTLAPFYPKRFNIGKAHYSNYYKASLYKAFERMIANEERGIKRMTGVTN